MGQLSTACGMGKRSASIAGTHNRGTLVKQPPNKSPDIVQQPFMRPYLLWLLLTLKKGVNKFKYEKYWERRGTFT
jgi:hypothetical protein